MVKVGLRAAGILAFVELIVSQFRTTNRWPLWQDPRYFITVHFSGTLQRENIVCHDHELNHWLSTKCRPVALGVHKLLQNGGSGNGRGSN